MDHPSTDDWLADGRRRAACRRALLDWYHSNRRDLPWRRSADPYAVWLSEIMLQQTRVATARGYYERFLERFPTLADLATAPEADVLKAWEGLGYYSRARNLRRAAQAIVERHGGRVPAAYEELIELPGVGPYTAAAVSSIAFDRPHPALDGNVIRVLTRLLRVEADPRKAAVRARLVAAGEALMPRGPGAGDLNQALIELGARVCLPRRPRCADCPVARWCRARAELDDPAAIPFKAPRKARPHLTVTAGIIRDGRGRVLLAQRPPNGMLAGLWEFPGGKREAGESLPACLRREIREELAIDIEVEEEVARVDHEYTHLSITLHAFRARRRAGRVQALAVADWCWVRAEQVDDYAMPRADRRVLEELDAAGRPLRTLIEGD